MKILSNEQLVAAYRNAEKQGNDQDWIMLLKKEIRNRGLRPFGNRDETLNGKGEDKFVFTFYFCEGDLPLLAFFHCSSSMIPSL